MKRLFSALLLVLPLFILRLVCYPPFISAHGLAGTIHMADNHYDPSEATIYKDEKLIFQNNSSENYWPVVSFQTSLKHPAEKYTPDKPIPPGQAWLFKFSYVGDWHYSDSLHPTIKGTIKTIIGRGTSHVIASKAYSRASVPNLWERVIKFLQSL